MGDVDYRPDSKGVAELMMSGPMQALVTIVAIQGADFARSISPDDPPYGEGYIASFSVDGGHVEKIAGSKRAVAYIVNDSDHAAAVEYGNRGNAGHHVLSKTVDDIEAGL